MKAFLLILLYFFLVSCNKTEGEFNPETIDQNIEPETMDQNIEPNKIIVFDSKFSGLVDLPMDEGGEHKAHPLTSESNSGLGFYAYTPGGYYDNEKNYPLILFLHGSGQSGTREFPQLLNKVLEHGPPKLIENNNWKPTYPSLVVSPQSEGDWTPESVHHFIEYLIDTYRVNTKRIYITGLSMGGRGCWFYEGEMGYDSYAAALVPICGRGQPSYVKNLVNTPIWAFHGADDTVVKPFTNNGSFQMVNEINANGPIFEAKLTIYPEVGHDSWPRTYDSSGMGTESLEYDPFDMTIYDWMFQFRKE
ncbi:MAG: hypothetical protein V7687_16865 [Maribacter arcticus]|uniref:carboxylesterase family protein n=1 Tax=Maribacter arcticus TaxID=561365 RepID=UPI0030020C41